MRNEQHELQTADISFYPPLDQKAKKWRDVFLSTPSGRIYRGVRVKGSTIDIPFFVSLDNRPEFGEREVSLSEMTKDLLREKIRERLLSSRR